MIKFRAWDKEYKEMREVVAIDFYHETYSWILDDYREMEQSWEDGNIEDVILMQYTGVIDKNGVEIFAGDILRLTLNDYAELKKPDIFTVSSDEEYYGDVLYLQNINYHINQDDTRDSIEIIGNIYENPELLEVA